MSDEIKSESIEEDKEYFLRYKNQYPHVFTVVQRYFSIPLATLADESVFSYMKRYAKIGYSTGRLETLVRHKVNVLNSEMMYLTNVITSKS